MKATLNLGRTDYLIPTVMAYDQSTTKTTTLGSIENRYVNSPNGVFGIMWTDEADAIISNLNEDVVIQMGQDGGISLSDSMTFNFKRLDDALINDATVESDADIINRTINASYKEPFIIFADNDSYDKYREYFDVARKLRAFYESYPIYKKIVLREDDHPKIVSVADVLFLLNDETRAKMITGIAYAPSIKSVYTLVEQVLDSIDHTDGYDLMTQEEQVEAFINFSKLVTSESEEIVSDEMLADLTNSEAYKTVVAKLTDHGFGLSKTQQFNVLQSVGYLGRYIPASTRSNQRIIHNLSDMGSGKTLMTVEAIFMMDMLDADHVDNVITDEEKAEVGEYAVHNKNLVAPKLSVESSWIDTFKLFYDVNKVDDNRYELRFTRNDIDFVSDLYVAGFTVTNSGVSVDKTLPYPTDSDEFLIIDEIHQLVTRQLSARKFFNKNVIPSDSYVSFVLSGTLSNLTTDEWFNYIHLMDIPFNTNEIDGVSAKHIGENLAYAVDQIELKVRQSAEKIGTTQHRQFDDFEPNNELVPKKSKATNQHKMFDLLYAPKVLTFHSGDDFGKRIASNMYSIGVDSDIISTPNFELFYQLVGNSSITAESTQVAEELFGDQKQQHQADVINVESPLTDNDVKLLRQLHAITLDYNVYKSQAIATQINNAILNLNDGLAKKTIYDLVNKYANSNSRFLAYLSGLDLDLLKSLPESNLIQQPEIKDTPKFKVLNDILADSDENTYLVVVNDYDAMVKLSDALDIEHMTKADVKDQINYQNVLDAMFAKQNVVVVPQHMIKSSLDLVAANRLVQYQLNTEISDIIQTQNRINRIGQKRETKAYYIATDALQKNVIDMFLETYKNIRVAHKGIIELFVDMSSQVNVVNDYIGKAVNAMSNTEDTNETVVVNDEKPVIEDNIFENAGQFSASRQANPQLRLA